jgi:hypothetical protein
MREKRRKRQGLLQANLEQPWLFVRNMLGYRIGMFNEAVTACAACRGEGFHGAVELGGRVEFPRSWGGRRTLF